MPIRLIRTAGVLAATLTLLRCASPSPPAAPAGRTQPAVSAGTGLPFRSAIFESSANWVGNPSKNKVKVWYSSSGVRERSDSPQGVSYILRVARYRYGWSEGTKTGVRSTVGGGGSFNGFPDPLDLIREVAFSVAPSRSKLIGTERLDGVRVKHYDFRWQDPIIHAYHAGSVWILEDRLFPIKFLNTGYGGNYEVVNSHIQFDAEISPDLFEPPRDVRFIDLNRLH